METEKEMSQQEDDKMETEDVLPGNAMVVDDTPTESSVQITENISEESETNSQSSESVQLSDTATSTFEVMEITKSDETIKYVPDKSQSPISDELFTNISDEVIPEQSQSPISGELTTTEADENDEVMPERLQSPTSESTTKSDEDMPERSQSPITDEFTIAKTDEDKSQLLKKMEKPQSPLSDVLTTKKTVETELETSKSPILDELVSILSEKPVTSDGKSSPTIISNTGKESSMSSLTSAPILGENDKQETIMDEQLTTSDETVDKSAAAIPIELDNKSSTELADSNKQLEDNLSIEIADSDKTTEEVDSNEQSEDNSSTEKGATETTTEIAHFDKQLEGSSSTKIADSDTTTEIVDSDKRSEDNSSTEKGASDTTEISDSDRPHENKSSTEKGDSDTTKIGKSSTERAGTASKPTSPSPEAFNANAMKDDEAQEATTISKTTEVDLAISETIINDNSSSNAEVQTDFVDTEMTDSSNQADLQDVDPIAGESAPTETILPEEDRDKYTITHFNEYDEYPCGMCEKHDVPKYIAQRDLESVYICGEDCLQTFKDKNGENFVEKILRLRSFATQDKPLVPEKTSGAVEEPAAIEIEFEIADNYKKDPFRACGYCKKCIDIDNYISWEVLEFCNEGCLLRYQRALINSRCARCQKLVTESVLGKYCVRFGNDVTQFCCTSCLLSHKRAYKFCAYCQEDMRLNSGQFKNLCSRRCLEACHIERAVKEHNTCSVCHQKKQIGIKFKLNDKIDSFCGEPCFVAYKFVNKIEPEKCAVCMVRLVPTVADLMIYANDTKNFLCSKDCQKIFLIQQRTIVLCGHCNVKKYNFDMITLCDSGKDMAYACCNVCLQVCLEKNLQYGQMQKLAEVNIPQLEQAIKYKDFIADGKNLSDVIKVAVKEIKTPIQKIVMRRPKGPVKQRNVGTLCKPRTYNKGLTCGPDLVDAQTQTDEQHKLLLPVPLPIFVPVPLHMYVDYVPMPTPIPIPLPVPIFIPTKRKSVGGILKEIQKIKNRVPADPLEAELLMMAEMAAGDKKKESSSESEPEVEAEVAETKETFDNEAIEPSAAFGEDVLTMALKMANEFEEPADMENAVATTTIAAAAQETERETMEAAARIESIMDAKRKSIRDRKPRRTEPLPTDDSNLNLKYSFGVNAWKQWVTIKNLESQKTRAKSFKTELLQLTADDLNISLCLFVKEVRKPSGADYAPDTIYYLCLGIQQYLYENNRIDNIFCDPFYEKFTDSFNEVCQKFANLYNDSQYIVTRVEEEHLWESKQLGAHSPLVLLNTLMFFNTKHFSLTTVDEHLQLSFSHIMKHWKRNPNVPGSRNVLLRFYPPQAATEGGRKKKVYEQQENDVNPLRCPVKLYEFYLSKCPESVKTRNDVFYLQPERSCVPDSPVWYSTMALTKEPLEKMLNRVKMVKEINVALLTS